MKKRLLILSMFIAGIINVHAQQGPAEIKNVPPAVQQSWGYQMQTTYMEKYGRYGITTWYMDKGTFMSITVFRRGSDFVRLFMYFTPQGELLDAGTDE